MTIHASVTAPHHRDGGDVVLVHGIGCTHAVWDDIVPMIGTNRTVHTLDLPGAGSSEPIEPVSVPDLAASVRRYLDIERLDDVVLVGHSLGGMVAQELVCTDTNGIRALIACNTIASGGERIGDINDGLAAHAETEGAVSLAEALIPSLLGSASGQRTATIRKRFVEEFAVNGAAAIAAQLRCVRTFDVTERLMGLSLPTMVFTGAEDGGIEGARAIASSIPGAHICELPGAGHMAPMEFPERFVCDVNAFLQAVPFQGR